MSPEPAAPPASRRRLHVTAIVIAVVAVAVVATGIATRASEADRLRERADAMSVPAVVVITPGKAGAATTLDLPGRIEAQSRAPIYARVSGYLKRWYADIGTSVKAGQLLAEIETPDLDQQLLQARAELANARANAALAATTARRWQELLATGTVSRQGADEKAGDLVAKQSLVNALQANVERYEAMKRFSRIVAPFDGVVTSRSTDVGALINVGSAQGAELFVISDTRKLRVYVSVPQSYATAIPRGAKASLSVPESPGKTYAATVQSLSQAISTASGSMLIQLTADNPDAALLPGGFASVSFPLPSTPGVLSIPPSALMFDKTGLRVATVDAQGKVVLKPVTVARDTGTLIELSSGLAPDDRLIESPPDGIANGDLVRIARPDDKATAPGDPERR
jgi:membrane fusion protein, multidrug efflux system